jgi:hypothetical protein
VTASKEGLGRAVAGQREAGDGTAQCDVGRRVGWVSGGFLVVVVRPGV